MLCTNCGKEYSSPSLGGSGICGSCDAGVPVMASRTPSNPSGAICKTCGGTPQNHKPSIFDPLGIADPAHKTVSAPTEGVEPVSEVDTILEEWIGNAMSTSMLGWSPIDGYKGHYDGSEEAAGNDYERYKAKARAAIERLIAEARIEQVMQDFLSIQQYLDGAGYDESVLIDWRIETLEQIKAELNKGAKL